MYYPVPGKKQNKTKHDIQNTLHLRCFTVVLVTNDFFLLTT